jgi:acyl-homoserine-lactone acylase
LVGPVGTRPSFRTQSGIIEIQRSLAAGKMTHERARDLILANRSMAAERMVPGIVAICETDPALRAPCEVLRTWDGKAELNSRGATLFFAFLRRLGGNAPNLWRTPFDPANPAHTPSGFDPAAAPAVKTALAAAVQELAAAGIPLDAPLGAVQGAPRTGGRIPIHGGPAIAGILNMMQTRPDGAFLTPVHGSSYMQVVSFGPRGPQADALLSYSQSTDPASPHSQDQTRAFSEKRWHSLPFTAAEIRRHALAPARRLRE